MLLGNKCSQVSLLRHLEIAPAPMYWGLIFGGKMFFQEFDVSVKELKEKMNKKEKFLLLDIREPFEYEICCLPGAKLIPMGEIPNRLSELDSENEMIVYCHAGVRSARVVSWLKRNGFERAKNLSGGIDAWSCLIDPSVPRY